MSSAGLSPTILKSTLLDGSGLCDTSNAFSCASAFDFPNQGDCRDLELAAIFVWSGKSLFFFLFFCPFRIKPPRQREQMLIDNNVVNMIILSVKWPQETRGAVCSS